MGYEPIDAEYEMQMEAVYNGVLEQYYQSDSYHEDISNGIDEFIADRKKSFYIEKPSVAECAFGLLAEARELLASGHFAAAQVIAGAAAEVTLGDALLKPMVYGFVHSDTVAPMMAGIIENARQVYRFTDLLIEIVSKFSGIDLKSSGLWQSVDKVRTQRDSVLHGDGLSRVTKEEAENSLQLATTLLETVFPAVLKNLGLHLHDATVCGAFHQGANV